MSSRGRDKRTMKVIAVPPSTGSSIFRENPPPSTARTRGYEFVATYDLRSREQSLPDEATLDEHAGRHTGLAAPIQPRAMVGLLLYWTARDQ